MKKYLYLKLFFKLGGGHQRVKKIALHFWMIQTMLKNKIKKYGNGDQIGRALPFPNLGTGADKIIL